jgi:hypothetical protein
VRAHAVVQVEAERAHTTQTNRCLGLEKKIIYMFFTKDLKGEIQIKNLKIQIKNIFCLHCRPKNSKPAKSKQLIREIQV